MLSVKRNEAKYQMIKLVRSGRSLREAKAIVRVLAMGLDPEYANPNEVLELATLEGTIHRLTATRGAAKDLAKVRFAPRKGMAKNREEFVAKWATGYRGRVPLNWKRDGNLIRRGPPNAPQPGSSEGKIGRTTIRGQDKVLKDMRHLVQTLARLQRAGNNQGTRALQKAYRGIRVAVSSSISDSG